MTPRYTKHPSENCEFCHFGFNLFPIKDPRNPDSPNWIDGWCRLHKMELPMYAYDQVCDNQKPKLPEDIM